MRDRRMGGDAIKSVRGRHGAACGRTTWAKRVIRPACGGSFALAWRHITRSWDGLRRFHRGLVIRRRTEPVGSRFVFQRHWRRFQGVPDQALEMLVLLW